MLFLISPAGKIRLPTSSQNWFICNPTKQSNSRMATLFLIQKLNIPIRVLDWFAVIFTFEWGYIMEVLFFKSFLDYFFFLSVVILIILNTAVFNFRFLPYSCRFSLVFWICKTRTWFPKSKLYKRYAKHNLTLLSSQSPRVIIKFISFLFTLLVFAFAKISNYCIFSQFSSF